MREPSLIDPAIGLPNCRDLGGLPAGTKRVRVGQLFRSGVPDATASSGERPQHGGIIFRSCCDLRSVIERQRHPVAWGGDAAPQIFELAVDVDIRAFDAAALASLRAESVAADAARGLMRQIYRALPSHCAPVLGALFVRLQDPAQRPLLVHCTAGKDRTGFVIAMLLYALGVDEAAIRDDYLRTNQQLDRLALNVKVSELLKVMIGVTADDVVLDALNAARLDYLEAAIDEVTRAYGSIEDYLRDAAGLDDGALAQLRAQLLE